MKALITGITGFVGGYLTEQLTKLGWEVAGTSRQHMRLPNCYQLNQLLEKDISEVIHKVRPTHIFHLAGFSNVKDSWEAKASCLEANILGTIHLFEAVRKTDSSIKIITIGSSEEYGQVNKKIVNVSENEPLRPLSPYGISKCAVGMTSVQFSKAYNMNIVHVRPFNHIGPFQKEGFIASDFAKVIAEINSGCRPMASLKVGNLDAIRDFTDVRDIVRAYCELAEKGVAGEIYNVCSGKGTSARELLGILLSFSTQKIDIITDASKFRALDVPRLVGDPKKLLDHTGWVPEWSLKDTLKSIYEYWLTRV